MKKLLVCLMIMSFYQTAFTATQGPLKDGVPAKFQGLWVPTDGSMNWKASSDTISFTSTSGKYKELEGCMYTIWSNGEYTLTFSNTKLVLIIKSLGKNKISVLPSMEGEEPFETVIYNIKK